MPKPAFDDYPVTLVEGDDANGIASVISTLLIQNFESFPDRIRIARKLTRPMTISATDIEGSCTITCRASGVSISNGATSDSSVAVTATVDQILDLSQLRMKGSGLLPVGFFTKRGLRVLAAIASGSLRVRGLIAHPIVALRVIALLSVES